MAVLTILFAIPGLALQPIKISGQYLVNSGSENLFQIIGVAYQPGGQSGYDPGSGKDPLSDGDACLRDAALMQRLGINAIRVYNLDPKVNHDLCASIFNSVGIYMLLDVNSPLGGESINRGDPGSSYTTSYLTRIFAIVEAFKSYPNTLAFFGGNEIINDIPSAKIIPPYIRAVTRDLKNYIAKHSQRTIPVGYSAADVREVLTDTWAYLQCTTSSDPNTPDPSRADLFALNSYSWCGPTATFQTAGYDKIVSNFGNSTIPVFFSEYGCNKVIPRTFEEVGTLYGSQVTPVLSGGLVYQWTQDESNYGLVNVSTTSQLRSDYDNLQLQFSKLDITKLQSHKASSSSNTPTAPPACSSDLISNSGLSKDFTLPKLPDGAQDLIDNGIPNPPVGKLVDVTETQVKKEVLDSRGTKLEGLAINKLPADATVNAPVTASSATGSPTATASGTPAPKKAIGSQFGTSGLCVAMAIVVGGIMVGR